MRNLIEVGQSRGTLTVIRTDNIQGILADRMGNPVLIAECEDIGAGWAEHE